MLVEAFSEAPSFLAAVEEERERLIELLYESFARSPESGRLN